ncbi:MAG: isoprenylcysteine carboxylmethyltransferase family protein [Acidobacteria bacterium]|nr:isoprenylcysteine carboxylmethyltransferase family protein [Acidobacteriota bacterium]
MPLLRAAAAPILVFNWIAFSALIAANHIQVRAARRRLGIPEEQPSLRDPRSMQGLAIEGLSFLLAFVFYQSPSVASTWLSAVSILTGLTSVAVLYAALRHLGMQWRIKAVVTTDHRLITTGPYAHLRHPVFFALFCLLLSHTLIATRPYAAIAACVICIYGTQIRINAEDGLLHRRFGTQFETYKSRVPAWLPN